MSDIEKLAEDYAESERPCGDVSEEGVVLGIKDAYVYAYEACEAKYAPLNQWIEMFRNVVKHDSQPGYKVAQITIQTLLAELEAIMPKEP